MVNASDDLVVPVRTATALRDEVAHRVTRVKRRRRVRRVSIPAGLMAVVAAFVLARVPGGETSVGTPASGGNSGEAVEVPSGPGPTGSGGAVPGNTPTEVAPPSMPWVVAPPPEPRPRDNATEVFRSADIRLAVNRGSDVWELGPDWAPVRKLVSGDPGGMGGAGSPAWSPDGRQLAYHWGQWSSFGSGHTSSIRILDLASMQTRVVIESADTVYTSPRFSSDGTMLVFERGTAPKAVPPSLELKVMVVDLDAPPGNDRWEVGPGDMPSWLPDNRILFRCQFVLCTSDAHGADRTQVPNSEDERLFGPMASPDGNWVTFSAGDPQVLHVMRVDGSGRRALGNNRANWATAWSPDSSRILFSTDYGIRSIRRDGTDLRIVNEESREGSLAVTRR